MLNMQAVGLRMGTATKRMMNHEVRERRAELGKLPHFEHTYILLENEEYRQVQEEPSEKELAHCLLERTNEKKLCSIMARQVLSHVLIVDIYFQLDNNGGCFFQFRDSTFVS